MALKSELQFHGHDVFQGHVVPVLLYRFFTSDRTASVCLACSAQHLGLDTCRALSRTPGMAPAQWAGGAGRGAPAPGVRERWRGEDEYGQQHASGFNITGRILLNLWRIMKGEVGG